MKTRLLFFLLIIVGVTIAFQFQPIKQTSSNLYTSFRPVSLIDKNQLRIITRVKVPEGYKRVVYPKGSFQAYLQNYKLKAYGSQIINYDGTAYFWQKGHVGVLDIPVPKNGLQQCADALIRIRSEYLWDQDRKAEIGFNFTSGHYCSWSKYAAGYRPKINGNTVSFHKTSSANHSKENFYKYLNLIYTYSGTLSLYHELPKINDTSKLQIGDMLIKGGSPGHIVMIADQIVNDKGENMYVLIQGNTPAQSVHLVKNLEDDTLSPWYTLEKDVVIPVSNYTFQSSKFVRFK